MGAKSHRELGLKGLAWKLRVIPLYDPPLYDGELLRAIYHDYHYHHRLRCEPLPESITEIIIDSSSISGCGPVNGRAEHVGKKPGLTREIVVDLSKLSEPS